MRITNTKNENTSYSSSFNQSQSSRYMHYVNTGYYPSVSAKYDSFSGRLKQKNKRNIKKINNTVKNVLAFAAVVSSILLLKKGVKAVKSFKISDKLSSVKNFVSDNGKKFINFLKNKIPKKK